MTIKIIKNVPPTIGVPCPLEIDGKKFDVRKLTACFECKYFRGMKELTPIELPIEDKFHIVCQAPMTRSLSNVALKD